MTQTAGSAAAAPISWQREKCFTTGESPERGDQLIKLIRDCGMDGVLEGVEACYMQKAPSPTRAVEQCRQDFSALGIVSEKTWDDEDISFSKFCLVTDENSCLERFKEETREDLEVIDRGSAFVEVVPRGHSKAAAIERILGRYGLALEGRLGIRRQHERSVHVSVCPECCADAGTTKNWSPTRPL